MVTLKKKGKKKVLAQEKQPLLENLPSQTTQFNNNIKSIQCYFGFFPNLFTILLPILGLYFYRVLCYFTAEKQFKM